MEWPFHAFSFTKHKNRASSGKKTWNPWSEVQKHTQNIDSIDNGIKKLETIYFTWTIVFAVQGTVHGFTSWITVMTWNVESTVQLQSLRLPKDVLILYDRFIRTQYYWLIQNELIELLQSRNLREYLETKLLQEDNLPNCTST